jgi:hypothetical protein
MKEAFDMWGGVLSAHTNVWGACGVAAARELLCKVKVPCLLVSLDGFSACKLLLCSNVSVVATHGLLLVRRGVYRVMPARPLVSHIVTAPVQRSCGCLTHGVRHPRRCSCCHWAN